MLQLVDNGCAPQTFQLDGGLGLIRLRSGCVPSGVNPAGDPFRAKGAISDARLKEIDLTFAQFRKIAIF